SRRWRVRFPVRTRSTWPSVRTPSPRPSPARGEGDPSVLDYDVVIVGGGPAGLTAGLHLSQAGHRALLLEREFFGGNLKNVDVVEDYDELPAHMTGAQLAAEMTERAAASGLRLEQAEVTGLEVFSST